MFVHVHLWSYIWVNLENHVSSGEEHHMGVQEVRSAVLRGQAIPDEGPRSFRLSTCSLWILSWTRSEQGSISHRGQIWLGWKNLVDEKIPRSTTCVDTWTWTWTWTCSFGSKPFCCRTTAGRFVIAKKDCSECRFLLWAGWPPCRN